VLYTGTSGFSYQDWVGPFYPGGLPRQDWLHYYSQEFNSLELNSTYYVIPGFATMKSMAAKTGPNFRFSVKANQDITHTRKKSGEVFAAFTEALRPLKESGKLGCILAQFPYSFRCSRDNQSYIEYFRGYFQDMPVVIEFRNAGWIKPDIFSWLHSLNLGFCCVDEPRLPGLIPPVAERTSAIAYVRFHGRNSAKWWQHQFAYERYDYSYSAEELAEWLPKINKLREGADKTFIFANNHWQGQAVDTIRQLRLMLD
jgi:uncharacterized protein YecE (DUF72 family)